MKEANGYSGSINDFTTIGWIQRWAMYLGFCWEGIVFVSPVSTMTEEPWIINLSLLLYKFCVQPWKQFKSESRYKNLCMTRVLGFLIRFFSNYYTLHRSDLAARAAPLDPRLQFILKYSFNIEKRIPIKYKCYNI